MFEGLEHDSFQTDSATDMELVSHNEEMMAAVTHEERSTRAREHESRYRILMQRVLIMKHVL